MSALVLSVTILSSLSWSLFDMSRKHLAGGISSSAAVVWLMLLQAPIFLAFIFFEQWVVPGSDYWLPAAGSLILNILSNIWFIEAVHLAPLSLAVPILSLTPVFSVIGSYLILGEKTSAVQALGIIVIVTAIFMLGRSAGRLSISTEEKSKVRKGLMLMTLVAALFATVPVLDKICLRSVSGAEHAFMQCLGAAIALALFLKFKRQPLEAKAALRLRKWLLLATFFAAAALFTQLWSIQNMPVGLFDALKRSFGLVAALGLGLFVFKEALTKEKIMAVVAIGIGVLILLG